MEMVTRRGPATVEEVDEALIESVCSRLREKLSAEDAPDAEAFARQYYRWVAPDDMTERTELDAYGAALSHFQFARVRQPGETKVRLYNPHFDSDGWESTHTAIEIVTDDMPFLLDSVGMEVNRQTDPERLEALREHLLHVIGEVRAVVEDWQSMRERALELAAEAGRATTPVEADAEAKAFLEWLADDNFTFL